MIIRPFAAVDQEQARALILQGLGEHFGFIDPTLNPDLDDITAYCRARDGYFLVVENRGDLVGTGALILEAENTGRIVRMSVHRSFRRQGIARRLVAELLAEARRRGYGRVVVETNDDWRDAITLYERCGFRHYAHRNGEAHLELLL